jgi:3-hydroxybutyryl-CoA dehydrogenase
MSEPGLPERVAVLGAGAMGTGAAALFAAYGASVTLVVRRAEVAESVVAVVRDRLDRLLALGAIDSERARDGHGLIRATVGIAHEEAYDLIFEAVTETLDAKRSALAAAQPALADGGLIVSTTSSLPVDAIAADLADRTRFAAWHWFYPADLMRLVEIVPGEFTSRGTVALLRRWSDALDKQAIVVNRDTPGFIANRLQYALLREAWALVQDGVCDVEDVDLAVTAGLGARWAALGPFAAMDLAGLDVHAAVCGQLFPELAVGSSVPAALRELRTAGATGAKGGVGILGAYPPERLAAQEARRDRTLISLARDHDLGA